MLKSQSFQGAPRPWTTLPALATCERKDRGERAASGATSAGSSRSAASAEAGDRRRGDFNGYINYKWVYNGFIMVWNGFGMGLEWV